MWVALLELVGRLQHEHLAPLLQRHRPPGAGGQGGRVGELRIGQREEGGRQVLPRGVEVAGHSRLDEGAQRPLHRVLQGYPQAHEPVVDLPTAVHPIEPVVGEPLEGPQGEQQVLILQGVALRHRVGVDAGGQLRGRLAAGVHPQQGHHSAGERSAG